MQRGVLTLTQPELQLLSEKLAHSTQNVELLSVKLKDALTTGGQSTKLECSEDEAEIMMDVLPAPSVDGGLEVDLRQKLQDFLMKLRSSDTEVKKTWWQRLMG